jgi:hypothetical protein
MARRWSELSARTRRLIVIAGIVEAVLKGIMLIDLRRRPAGGIRGSKRAWAASALLNTAGIVPITYLAFGRRPSERAV